MPHQRLCPLRRRQPDRHVHRERRLSEAAAEGLPQPQSECVPEPRPDARPGIRAPNIGTTRILPLPGEAGLSLACSPPPPRPAHRLRSLGVAPCCRKPGWPPGGSAARNTGAPPGSSPNPGTLRMALQGTLPVQKRAKCSGRSLSSGHRSRGEGGQGQPLGSRTPGCLPGTEGHPPEKGAARNYWALSSRPASWAVAELLNFLTPSAVTCKWGRATCL